MTNIDDDVENLQRLIEGRCYLCNRKITNDTHKGHSDRCVFHMQQCSVMFFKNLRYLGNNTFQYFKVTETGDEISGNTVFMTEEQYSELMEVINSGAKVAFITPSDHITKLEW